MCGVCVCFKEMAKEETRLGGRGSPEEEAAGGGDFRRRGDVLKGLVNY